MYYLQETDLFYKYIYSGEQCIKYCPKTGDIIAIKDNFFFVCKQCYNLGIYSYVKDSNYKCKNH